MPASAEGILEMFQTELGSRLAPLAVPAGPHRGGSPCVRPLQPPGQSALQLAAPCSGFSGRSGESLGRTRDYTALSPTPFSPNLLERRIYSTHFSPTTPRAAQKRAFTRKLGLISRLRPGHTTPSPEQQQDAAPRPWPHCELTPASPWSGVRTPTPGTRAGTLTRSVQQTVQLVPGRAAAAS